MFRPETIVTKQPEMAYLNDQLRKGRLVLGHGHIFYQNFSTADGVLEKVHRIAGKFYGGGIHQFSWDDIYKNGKLIFQSRNIAVTYKYFERYLRRTE